MVKLIFCFISFLSRLKMVTITAMMTTTEKIEGLVWGEKFKFVFNTFKLQINPHTNFLMITRKRHFKYPTKSHLECEARENQRKVFIILRSEHNISGHCVYVCTYFKFSSREASCILHTTSHSNVLQSTPQKFATRPQFSILLTLTPPFHIPPYLPHISNAFVNFTI